MKKGNYLLQNITLTFLGISSSILAQAIIFFLMSSFALVADDIPFFYNAAGETWVFVNKYFLLGFAFFPTILLLVSFLNLKLLQTHRRAFLSFNIIILIANFFTVSSIYKILQIVLRH